MIVARLETSTKNVRAKVFPADAFESLSATIATPLPLGDWYAAGRESFPLIPVISCVPTLLIITVNGTFLSPGATSIFEPSVPKYASKNFTLRICLRKTPSATSAGPSLAPSYAKDNGVREVEIKKIVNNMISVFML